MLAFLRRKRRAATEAGQTAKALIVGLVVLYLLYAFENYLASLYGALSPANFLGFIVMGLITILGLSYAPKITHSEPAL